MSERDIQRRILLALAKEFHPRGIFWTCDTGQFVPASEIKRSLVDLAKSATKHPLGLLSFGTVRSILSGLRRMVVGLPGQSDIQGCLDGRWIGVEVKSAKGKQRKSQVTFQRAIEAAGGVYIVARSPEEAIEAIEASLQ